jgi:mannose-1-phosphate guanylyltransferase
MLEHYYAVIMAGGGGTRLWPLSRQARPKQMLRLVDDRTLFQIAVQRLGAVFPPERIFVVTVADQASVLQEQSPSIPVENFLLETAPRGTASVIGLAAIALNKLDPEAVMAVVTSDHIIQDEARFHRLLLSAYDVAQQDYLVTLGIAPTFPATGYGYIQRGECIGMFRELKAYRALGFKEKPDEERARSMLESGDHAWNSGMFVWRVSRILEEFAQQMPDLHTKLDEISAAWGHENAREVLGRVWGTIIPQTIDYGIMENADKVAVIPARDLGWSDVGSWDALFDVLPTDEDGNIVMGGRHIPLQTQDSLVYVDQDHQLIVTIGVEDLVVVDTGDVLLVCKKDQAQKVRQVVNQLKQSDDEYI